MVVYADFLWKFRNKSGGHIFQSARSGRSRRNIMDFWKFSTLLMSGVISLEAWTSHSG